MQPWLSSHLISNSSGKQAQDAASTSHLHVRCCRYVDLPACCTGHVGHGPCPKATHHRNKARKIVPPPFSQALGQGGVGNEAPPTACPLVRQPQTLACAVSKAVQFFQCHWHTTHRDMTMVRAEYVPTRGGTRRVNCHTYSACTTYLGLIWQLLQAAGKTYLTYNVICR